MVDSTGLEPVLRFSSPVLPCFAVISQNTVVRQRKTHRADLSIKRMIVIVSVA